MGFSEEVVAGHVLLDATGYIGPAPADFGVRGVNGTSIGFNDALFGRHVLYLGGIGTGKTVGMTELIHSIRAGMNDDDVMVVFDTKGDYYDAFFQSGDAVIAATSADHYQGQVSWNLFEELHDLPTGREAEDEIFELGNGLFSSMLEKAGDNTYWATAARDVFVAIVTALYRDSAQRSNADIRLLVSGMSTTSIVELIDRVGNEDLRGARHYIAKEGSNSATATMAFMQQVIQESFRSSFGKPGDFSIRRFLRGKNRRALFLEYDVAAGGMLAPIYKTMLDVAMKEAMSRQRPAGRVFVIMDEFALLPELTHLSNGLNFGRSLGLRFVVGAQNIRQVQEMYGEDMAASVLSAFGTVFAFRMFDGRSREFVRDRFGQNKKISRFESSVRNKGLNEATSYGFVVEDWDLSALPVGTCVAALPEHPPIRFTFASPEN